MHVFRRKTEDRCEFVANVGDPLGLSHSVRRSPSQLAIVACGSMGLCCCRGMRYSASIFISASANAFSGSPRRVSAGSGELGRRPTAGATARSSPPVKSRRGVSGAYSVRTSHAAYSAWSSVSATTIAIGWPLNRTTSSCKTCSRSPVGSRTLLCSRYGSLGALRCERTATTPAAC